MAKKNIRQWQIGILVLVLCFGLIFAMLTLRGVINPGNINVKPAEAIYGYWIEQDVPPYAADSFELREEGVFVDGSQVTTHYYFDGRTFSYRQGDDTYIYDYIKDTLIRKEPAHYKSVFTRQPLSPLQY